jgi:uncharacterized membrane protein
VPLTSDTKVPVTQKAKATENLVDRLGQHSALVATGLASFFVVLRLLSVAGFDVTTALVILQTQGTTSVIFGSLISVFALLPFAAYILTDVARLTRYPSRKRRRSPRAWLVVVFVLLVASLLISPLFLSVYVAASFLLALIVVVYHRMRGIELRDGSFARSVGKRVESRSGRVFIVLSVLFLSSFSAWVASGYPARTSV